MIKGNESDVAIIDFELQAKRGDNVLHLEIQRFAHISRSRFRIVMGFGSNCRILNGQVDYIENSKFQTRSWDDQIFLLISNAELEDV